MTRPRDGQRSKFWEAVRALESLDPEEVDPTEAKAFAERIYRSSWWRSQRVTGCQPQHCWQFISFYEPYDSARFGVQEWRPARFKSKWAVIHAMAHYLHHGDTALHGREFAQAYLKMVRRYLGAEQARLCREVFTSTKVKARVVSEEARSAQRERFVSRKMQSAQAEIEQSIAELEGLEGG